jgi:hypothetical protein
MAHSVTGLIAKHTVLEALSREHSLPWPVVLAGDLAILPLRDVDLAPFQTALLESTGDEWRNLSERLLEELRRSSRYRGPLMYFETEYFGGLGGQGAVVFKDGQLIFGPRWAASGPINHALKLLGVRIEAPSRDEFQTVGLHLYRFTDGWLKPQ